tara:strand:+ start:3634 stop:3888 length:255 start_codon:yes stop_codon:yes gene_type:complete
MFRNIYKMSQEYFDTHFQPWMQRVDQIVINSIGHSIYDLPDQFYADNFEAGSSPHDMADIVLRDFNNYYNFITEYNNNSESYLP